MSRGAWGLRVDSPGGQTYRVTTDSGGQFAGCRIFSRREKLKFMAEEHALNEASAIGRVVSFQHAARLTQFDMPARNNLSRSFVMCQIIRLQIDRLAVFIRSPLCRSVIPY